MDKRKGYVLSLINAGVRNSASERKKSWRLLHYVQWHPVITLTSKWAFRVLLLELGKNKLVFCSHSNVATFSSSEIYKDLQHANSMALSKYIILSYHPLLQYTLRLCIITPPPLRMLGSPVSGDHKFLY